MFDWYARDIAGFFVAFSLFPVVLLLPGAALLKALPVDLRDSTIERRLGLSLLCGFAAWPVVLALLGHIDVRVMAVVTVLAALAGARHLLRPTPRFALSFPLGAAAAVLALATAAALVQSLPWPTADGFLHHWVVWDAQKHAAVTRMILETGIPPQNFNWTLEAPDTGLPPLGYYYQFYTLPAVVSMLSGGTVEARHAIFAVQPWLMLALYVLILEVLRSIAPGSPSPSARLRS